MLSLAFGWSSVGGYVELRGPVVFALDFLRGIVRYPTVFNFIAAGQPYGVSLTVIAAPGDIEV